MLSSRWCDLSSCWCNQTKVSLFNLVCIGDLLDCHLVTSQFFTHPSRILTSYSRGSRFSLSLSIARIFPEKHLCRRIAFGIAIIVSLIYVGVLLISALMCKSSSRPWHNIHHRRCLNGRGMPFRSFVGVLASDFMADILLIAAPLIMLWQVKLPTKERRLILALFSCNLFSLLSFSTFAFIWYFVIDLGPDSIIFLSMFGLVQVSCSKLHK